MTDTDIIGVNTFQANPPWIRIFRSAPVWAIFVNCLTADIGIYTYLTNTPTYMHDVLRYDIMQVKYIGDRIEYD